MPTDYRTTDRREVVRLEEGAHIFTTFLPD
jgi:hypothetical protein